MRRGDIITVAAPGDYGKPRPAVVIQGDVLNPEARSTIVALMTSHLQDAPLLRLTVEPTADNGLKVRSQVQVNRLLSLPSTKVGPRIGRLSDREIVELNRLLAACGGHWPGMRAPPNIRHARSCLTARRRGNLPTASGAT